MGQSWLLIITFLVATACASEEQFSPVQSNGLDDRIQAFSDTDFNILFIGNSLTYTNNLADLVQKAAKQESEKDIGVHMIASGNFALIDHWSDQRMHEEIESGLYDYVVVQQGPSSQPYGRELLLEYGDKFKQLCDQNGSKLAFFMVWPSLEYSYTFSGVIKSYEMAADQTGAILCPVGQVWKNHFNTTQDYSYYGTDGFHPSMKGSKVAANVIVKSLLN